MQMQPDPAQGEISPWHVADPADLGAAPMDWITLAPAELSAARKRLADARAVHDRPGFAAAYDLLARVRAPMGLPDPLPPGNERWNRP
jgi:hypothetical protein